MEFFVMSRSGEYTPKDFTNNQCQKPGQPKYRYELRMVFPQSVKLDNHKFIVDHQRVHDLIHSLPLEGSCEQMQMDICAAIKKFFESLKIDLYGCNCRMVPPQKLGYSYMSYIYICDKIPAADCAIIASIMN